MNKTGLLLTLTLILTACGGGGGGSNNTGSSSSAPSSPSNSNTNTPTVDTHAWAANIIPAPYVETYITGLAPNINVDIIPQTFVTSSYPAISVNDTNGILAKSGKITVGNLANSKGQLIGYVASLPTTPGLAPGHYTGSFTVTVCTDTTCATPLRGSPFQYPYDITVTTATQPALSAMANATDWATYQGNAGHTGYVPITVDPSALSSRWLLPASSLPVTDGSITDIATHNGLLYLSSDQNVYAINESNAGVAWKTHMTSCTNCNYNPPATSSDGKVYVSVSQAETGTAAGTFAAYGLDASQGTSLYQSATFSGYGYMDMPPVVSGNNVYFSSPMGYSLVGLNKGTGSTLFTDTLGGSQFTNTWTPAIDASNTYVYLNGALNIYDNTSGTSKAPAIQGPYYTSTPNYPEEYNTISGANGSIFVADIFGANNNSGGLVAFNTTTATTAWHVDGSYNPGAAYANGTLYVNNVSNNSSQLEAHAESNGQLLWTWAPARSNELIGTNIIVTNNLLFVGTNMATYAIDLTTHNTVWTYPAPGDLAISANGILYINNNDPLYVAGTSANTSSNIVAINLH